MSTDRMSAVDLPPGTKSPPASVSSIKAATAASDGPKETILLPRKYFTVNPAADRSVMTASISEG